MQGKAQADLVFGDGAFPPPVTWGKGWGDSGVPSIRMLIPFTRAPPHHLSTSRRPRLLMPLQWGSGSHVGTVGHKPWSPASCPGPTEPTSFSTPAAPTVSSTLNSEVSSQPCVTHGGDKGRTGAGGRSHSKRGKGKRESARPQAGQTPRGESSEAQRPESWHVAPRSASQARWGDPAPTAWQSCWPVGGMQAAVLL